MNVSTIVFFVFVIFLGSGFALSPIQNGDFEVGLQDWSWHSRGLGGYPKDIAVVSADPSPEIVKDPSAPSGKSFLRFKNMADTSFFVATREYLLDEGTYKVVGFFNIEKKIKWQVGDVVKTIPPTSGWEKKEMDLVVTNKERAVSLSFNAEDPGLFQFDHFELYPAAGAPRETALDVGLEVSAPDKVFFEKDEKKLKLKIFSSAETAGALLYHVENAWGEEIFTKKTPAKIPAGETVELGESLTSLKSGHYRVLARFAPSKGAASYETELLFAVIPDRELATSTTTGEDSRFGCNMGGRPYEIRLAQKIGIRWVMCAPPLYTKWLASEPSKGEWLFYDDQVKSMNDAGIHLLGNLADAPTWAIKPDSKVYGGAWPQNVLPADWSGWENYVKKVVTHYAPRIKAWAVWNEPDHPGFLKVAEGESWVDKYQTILEKSFAAARQAAPNVRIVGGVATHAGALVPLFKKGALKTMDVGGFHWLSWTPKGYVRNTSDEMGLLGPKESSDNCIENLTDAMAEAGKKVPLWDTEAHFTQAAMEREFLTQPNPPQKKDVPFMTRLDGAAAIPRQYLAEWAAGVDKTFFWLLSAPFTGQRLRADTTMVEWDRSPGAQLVTYAVMTSILENAKFVKWEKVVENRTPIKIFTLTIPGGSVRVVFSDSDMPKDLILVTESKNPVVRDMFGSVLEGSDSFNGLPLKGKVHLSVSRSPVYVIEK